jgi:nucleoid DNA-binding protein
LSSGGIFIEKQKFVDKLASKLNIDNEKAEDILNMVITEMVSPYIINQGKPI